MLLLVWSIIFAGIVLEPRGALGNSFDIDDIDALIGSLNEAGQDFDARRAKLDSWPARWKRLYSHGFTGNALEEGALLLAEWGDGAKPAEVSGLLDTLSQNVRKALPLQRLAWRVGKGGAPKTSQGLDYREGLATASAINQCLYGDFGLKGNRLHYDDPANSFLSAVLRQRRGDPITLSVIWTAVARRVGLSGYVVTQVPGHVLVRIPVGDGQIASKDIYIDPFAGAVLDWQHVNAFAARSDVSMDPAALSALLLPSTPAEVHARMLRNVCHIYKDRGDDARLVHAVDQAVAVCGQESNDLILLRKAAITRLHQGQKELSSWLDIRP